MKIELVIPFQRVLAPRASWTEPAPAVGITFPAASPRDASGPKSARSHRQSSRPALGNGLGQSVHPVRASLF